MLQRDLSRQRSEAEWREADRKRIEMELQQAKRDMESEDLLDRIADNPSGRIFFLHERFEVLTAVLL
jgi:hypothetical protein